MDRSLIWLALAVLTSWLAVAGSLVATVAFCFACLLYLRTAK